MSIIFKLLTIIHSFKFIWICFRTWMFIKDFYFGNAVFIISLESLIYAVNINADFSFNILWSGKCNCGVCQIGNSRKSYFKMGIVCDFHIIIIVIITSVFDVWVICYMNIILSNVKPIKRDNGFAVFKACININVI